MTPRIECICTKDLYVNVHKKLSAELEQSKKLWYFLLPQYFSTIKKKKASEFLKNFYFCFIHYAKAFDCVDHSKLWKILQDIGIPPYLPPEKSI